MSIKEIVEECSYFTLHFAAKRQNEAEKSNQQAYKGKCGEVRAEEKSLHENLKQLKAEQTVGTESYGESYELC